ncbi:MAG: BrnT family toxin [Polyangiaceae bacterium]|nr:BrnT family toxin [Polyangiaceae bacterium]
MLWDVPTVVESDFEWDADKADANEAKHGVAFDEALDVFDDPSAVVIDDGSGSGVLLAIGHSSRGRLLAVVHIERGERVRIVSARPATRHELRIYTEGQPT